MNMNVQMGLNTPPTLMGLAQSGGDSAQSRNAPSMTGMVSPTQQTSPINLTGGFMDRRGGSAQAGNNGGQMDIVQLIMQMMGGMGGGTGAADPNASGGGNIMQQLMPMLLGLSQSSGHMQKA